MDHVAYHFTNQWLPQPSCIERPSTQARHAHFTSFAAQITHAGLENGQSVAGILHDGRISLHKLVYTNSSSAFHASSAQASNSDTLQTMTQVFRVGSLENPSTLFSICFEVQTRSHTNVPFEFFWRPARALRRSSSARPTQHAHSYRSDLCSRSMLEETLR